LHFTIHRHTKCIKYIEIEDGGCAIQIYINTDIESNSIIQNFELSARDFP